MLTFDKYILSIWQFGQIHLTIRQIKFEILKKKNLNDRSAAEERLVQNVWEAHTRQIQFEIMKKENSESEVRCWKKIGAKSLGCTHWTNIDLF